MDAFWDDPVRCEEALRQGRRVAKGEGSVRLATWNLRWFPTGSPKIQEVDATKVRWTACIIASHQMDIVAAQEVQLTAVGRAALRMLVSALGDFTGVEWKWESDACPEERGQHLAFLYNAASVRLSHVATHGELDPTGKPNSENICPGRLRPGLAAHVSSIATNVSWHFLTLHLDAGRTERDFNNRRESWQRIAGVLDEQRRAFPDDRVIIAGDFNTMGCKGCAVASGTEEIALLRTALATTPAPLTVAASTPGCSEYYQSKPALVDLVAHAGDLHIDGPVIAGGVCGQLNCRALEGKRLEALERLSDHCPVWLDIVGAPSQASSP